MDMKPIWIKVSWNQPPLFFQDELFISKPVEVQVVEELEIQDGAFIATEYTRTTDGFLTIGIKTDKSLKRAYARGKFLYERELVYVSNGIWISCPQYMWSERFKEYQIISLPIGLNQCGTIQFAGETITDERIITNDVKIRPSLVTEAEYIQMEQDLMTITEELLFHAQAGLGDTGKIKSLIDLETLDNQVEKLDEVIRQLEEAPAEKLSSERVRMNVDKLKKFDVRVLLEQEMYPFKQTVNALTTIRSQDIQEHRKIKGAILDFIETCERQSRSEQMMKVNLERQLHDVEEFSQKVVGTREAHFQEKFNSKKEWFRLQSGYFTERDKVWTKIILHLENLSHSYLLQDCEEEEWGDTHIFSFHPVYEESFETIEQLREQLRLQEPLKAFQHDLIQSPDLYEKWVFFKVMQHFSTTLGFAPENGYVMESILEYYQKHKTLRGFWIRLKGADSNCIVIGSEIIISGQRPDISFLFEESNEEKGVAFLDAKYKPYSKMSDWLQEDLVHSAKRYKELVKNGKSAFLVHPDAEKENEFEETKPHQYGYFLLKPGNEEGLSLFAKMLLHFHMEWDQVCPDCGEKKNVSVNDEFSYKTYYECTSCQSFWVQNKCWNSQKHLRNLQGKKLYKYLYRNYHKPTDHDWDVHCPWCGLSFTDRRRG